MTQSLTYKIIVNPTSGRGEGGQSVTQIETLLRNHGLNYEIVLTERPWHAAELAQQAAQAGFDVVVSAGGDGTLNEVLNGLMAAKARGGQSPALGVICVGRGNDFAFSMNIPAGLEAGCQALADDHRKSIDVGRVTGGLYPQGRYFGNGVGIGFDAVVGFEALKLKRLHGFPSYLVAALKTIFLYFQAPQVQIAFDGQQIELPALMVSIMNGRRMGGGFMMAPQGHSDDGLLDICIARQVSRPQIFGLIPKFMQGTQDEHPAIQRVLTAALRVTALQGVLPAHADGETLCTDGKELTLELLPRQIELICLPEK
ncbi:MAG TPA: diacylglycerol kinase [Chloroflexi bacterium]|nr:diacylglycerol kinase [Chloroflexota bacterium]